MVVVENRVGKLVELFIETPVSPEELQTCLTRFAALATQIEGKFVPVADCRRANIFPPEVAEGFLKLMRSDNTRVERAAILVGPSASFSMQLERMVREAGTPRRRAFREAEELEAWLKDVLTIPERHGLHIFLASAGAQRPAAR